MQIELENIFQIHLLSFASELFNRSGFCGNVNQIIQTQLEFGKAI